MNAPTQREYQRAIMAIAVSRQQVERLLADVSRDEHYVLSLLGPILVNLKEADSHLRQLQNNA
jgi:hypothetical protein